GVGSVHKLLTNTIYIGRWRFNQTSSKTRTRKADDDVVEIPVPAIIEPQVFEQVQRQLRSRSVALANKIARMAWARRQSAIRSVSIRDGLIAIYKDRKVRVRISGDIATIAIKGPRIGIGRPEFEYEIPMGDAERMLSTICQDDTLEKQ